MRQLEELTKTILAFRDERNWAQFHKPKDMALSLVLEAAEVAEHFQWKNGQEALEYVEQHREAIGEELSDVLYWVLLLSHDLGIDLAKAFAGKMEKNKAKYPVKKARNSHLKYSELLKLPPGNVRAGK